MYIAYQINTLTQCAVCLDQHKTVEQILTHHQVHICGGSGNVGLACDNRYAVFWTVNTAASCQDAQFDKDISC